MMREAYSGGPAEVLYKTKKPPIKGGDGGGGGNAFIPFRLCKAASFLLRKLGYINA